MTKEEEKSSKLLKRKNIFTCDNQALPNQAFKRQTASLSLPGAHNYPWLIFPLTDKERYIHSYSSILNYSEKCGEGALDGAHSV